MAIDAAAQVHPSAVIEEGAVIGAGASVGPFCIVGAEVELGPRVALRSHVVVTGRTQIGEELGAFSRFGIWPQILLAVGLIVPLQMSWNAAEAIGSRQEGMAHLAYLQPALAAAVAALMVTLSMRGSRRRGGAAA